MNCVLAQQLDGKDIPVGTAFRKGTKITVVVGNGRQSEVPVPNYLGLPLEKPRWPYKGANSNRVLCMIPTAIKRPERCQQNPPAVEGNKIREGQLVDLWVAGPAPANAGN
jgi:hypothetical protein